MKYWAAEKDTETLISKIGGFLSQFSLNVEAERSSISSIWTRNLRMYYHSVIGSDSIDSALGYGGEDGELIEMHVPVARADVRKMISIACRQRLHFKAQAESGEYTSKANTEVADALALEYSTAKDVDLNKVREKALELAIVCGHSFILNQWDAHTQRPVFKVIPPWMTTYNYNVDSMEELDWFVVHYFANRYTLAEEYPDKKDLILTSKGERASINPWSISFGITDYSDDDILVSEFYHKGTPALPQGRLVKFIDYFALEDIANPYLDKDGTPEIPISEVMPESIQPYFLGYPKICDLLPIQEMTDHQFSVMASIFAALGTPAILNPRGSGMNASNMSGLKVISYSPQQGDGLRGTKPEILQLCQMPPGLLDTIQIMSNFQQRLSNISGALMGQLPPGITAASAIATLSANAVEFIEPLSMAVHTALERAMFRAIMQTAQFMDEQGVVESVGPDNLKAVLTFTSDDLMGLRRVNLFTQNPLTMFSGGRQKIAEDYMKMGLITTPEEYDSVMIHGTIEPVQEKRATKSMRVSWENQELRQGKRVMALAIDDHAYDIYKHSELLNDPEIRKNPALIQLIDDHIQEHLELSRTVDVGLYAMVQTGKNVPPDQNTPTGQPEIQPEDVRPAGADNVTMTEEIPGARPARPANPAFDLGEAQ